MPDKPDPIDVSQLGRRNLSEAAFPAAGKQDFRVHFDAKIHERIAAHAAEKLSLEICGVLVGQWQRDADGPYVLVNESIRCDKAVSNAGDVTLTHEAWNEVHREMDTKFTDRQIVGWYHSHPSYGIFLSDRDMFIQDHFFNGPGQIAHVVDPVNGVEGVFHWRDGKAKLLPHFWVGRKVHLSSQGTSRKPSSASPAASSAPPPSGEPAPPFSVTLTWAMGVVCLVLLGYLLGSMKSAWEQKAIVAGVVRHYGLIKGLRPGLREGLDEVHAAMQMISAATATLAKEHIAAAGDAADEKKKQWESVLTVLRNIDHRVSELNAVYSLTPEEAAEVQKLIDAREAELAAVRAAAAEKAAKSSGGKTTAQPPQASAASLQTSAAAPAASPAGDKPADPPKPVAPPADTGTK